MSTSFFIFLQLESSKEIISSLLFPNTKKAGTDSFSSIPALKPRYPLDNTSFFGCQLFRFRNKISFWFFSLFLIRFVFTIQLFVDSSCKNIFFFFWFLFVCLHFFDKIDYSVIQILLIMFPKYKYHVFLSASLRFFSFSLGFLLFVFSSQIRNLWLLLADLKIHSVPNLFSYVSTTFYKVMKRSLIVLWTVPPFLGFPPYFFGCLFLCCDFIIAHVSYFVKYFSKIFLSFSLSFLNCVNCIELFKQFQNTY